MAQQIILMVVCFLFLIFTASQGKIALDFYRNASCRTMLCQNGYRRWWHFVYLLWKTLQRYEVFWYCNEKSTNLIAKCHKYPLSVSYFLIILLTNYHTIGLLLRDNLCKLLIFWKWMLAFCLNVKFSYFLINVLLTSSYPIHNRLLEALAWQRLFPFHG